MAEAAQVAVHAFWCKLLADDQRIGRSGDIGIGVIVANRNDFCLLIVAGTSSIGR